jgi:hypothetical protein
LTFAWHCSSLVSSSFCRQEASSPATCNSMCDALQCKQCCLAPCRSFSQLPCASGSHCTSCSGSREAICALCAFAGGCSDSERSRYRKCCCSLLTWRRCSCELNSLRLFQCSYPSSFARLASQYGSPDAGQTLSSH